VRRVRDRLIGEFDIPGMPARFSKWRNEAPIHEDLLGEQNEEVLRGLLAMSDSNIAALYADRVLASDAPGDRAARQPPHGLRRGELSAAQVRDLACPRALSRLPWCAAKTQGAA
jgi:hypothetical protein